MPILQQVREHIRETGTKICQSDIEVKKILMNQD